MWFNNKPVYYYLLLLLLLLLLRAAVKERSTKPNTLDITATTAEESSIAHPHGKNVA